MILITAAFMILGAAASLRQQAESNDQIQNGFLRNPAGGSAQEYTVRYSVGGSEEKEVTFSLEPRRLTDEQAKKLLDEASQQWENVYLGENPSPDQVTRDLVLPDEFSDGAVTVSYQFSDYNLIDTQGVIQSAELTQEGSVVDLTAKFSCEEHVREEIRHLKLVLPDNGDAADPQAQVQEAIAAAQEADPTGERFFLPGRAGTNAIQWKAKRDNLWLLFFMMGPLAAFAYGLREKEQEKEREKKRLKELTDAYPQMVDQLSLLLRSGMTLRHAWERMVSGYVMRRRNGQIPVQPVMEEMKITYREMCEGRSEAECCLRFADRCAAGCYRRFGSIITQNLSKGSTDICRLLTAEAEEALQEKKNRAKRLGEEAGGKLLGPMMLMLSVVLLVVLYPALIHF